MGVGERLGVDVEWKGKKKQFGKTHGCFYLDKYR